MARLSQPVNHLGLPVTRPHWLLLALFLYLVPARFAQAAQHAQPISYINRQFGFRVVLPRSWAGYSVLTQHQGDTDSAGSEPPSNRFSVITLRHPRWTPATPREDIPIMVFSLAQWNRVQNEDMIVGAAPFPPSELARNEKYVFALPARYDYDDLTGVEEVHKIIAAKPLHPF